jgi:hypothetical protein
VYRETWASRTTRSPCPNALEARFTRGAPRNGSGGRAFPSALFLRSPLSIPQGSRLHGSVVQSKPARLWHRSGRLRFLFHGIEHPLHNTGCRSHARPSRARSQPCKTGRRAHRDIPSQSRGSRSAGLSVPHSARFLGPLPQAWVSGVPVGQSIPTCSPGARKFNSR